jgi:type VI protein secretion system component VasK
VTVFSPAASARSRTDASDAILARIDVDEHAALAIADRQRRLRELDTGLRGRRLQQPRQPVPEVPWRLVIGPRGHGKSGRPYAGSGQQRDTTHVPSLPLPSP